MTSPSSSWTTPPPTAPPAIAHDFARWARFPVHVLSEPEKGVGCTVDTGFRYAIGHGATLPARTDADCLPRPGRTAGARDALRHGAGLVCGRVDARRDEHGPPGRAAFRALVRAAACFGRIRPAHHRRHGYLTPYGMHTGNNMAVTAARYEAVGGMPRRPSPTDPSLHRQRSVAGGRHDRARPGGSASLFGVRGSTGALARPVGA
ncbi:hypothetical protein OZK63_18205 [Streptomyces sp. UMAF16]|nr:hypothetical protein [Streptomyces sp. UMAF16]